MERKLVSLVDVALANKRAQTGEAQLMPCNMPDGELAHCRYMGTPSNPCLQPEGVLLNGVAECPLQRGVLTLIEKG